MVPTVLFEDNHLIAVLKPAGLLVQGDRSGEACLLDVVKADLKTRYKKPGEVFLGLIHRLDKPVQGVVLLAKTSKAASRLSEQFRERSTSKTYHALVEGSLDPKEAVLTHYMGVDATNRGVEISDDPAPGLKPAKLAYKVLAQGPEFSLLEVDLRTGRKHQIRAQLARIGHPLAGDAKYGAKKPFAWEGIGLLAYSLGFNHPVRKEERIEVLAPATGKQAWAKWL